MATKLPSSVTRWAPLAQAYGDRYGIDPRVILAQIYTESRGYADRVSSANAQGVSQFIPSTAKSYGVKFGTSRGAVKTQIRGEAKYLKDLGGTKDIAGALAKYAGGPGNPQPGYANQVLGLARSLKGGALLKAAGGSGAVSTDTGSVTPRSVPDSGANGLALIQALTASNRQPNPITPIAPPSFAAHPTLPQMAQVPTSGGGPSAPPDVNALLQAIQTQSPVDTSSSAPASAAGGPVSVSGKMPKGVATFEGKKVAAWIKPWLVKARRAGWKGSVGSGYRSFADQTRIYNSGVRPAAKPGTSNHEGADFPRGAVDVDRQSAAQLAAILRRLGAPLQWAGAKDPVHFSHPHNGSY